LRIFFRFCVIVILIIYFADIIVFKGFFTRLTIVDILKNIKEIKVVQYLFTDVFNFFEKIQIICLFLVGVFGGWLFISDKTAPSKLFKNSIVFAAAIFLLIGVTGSEKGYVHSWLYKNVFELNRINGNEIPYSEEFKKNTLQKTQDILAQDPIEIEPKKVNIIILCFESLSMYHSKFFSGLNDFTPAIDRIAKDNSAFINFYSNGFATESGLVAMLRGECLIPKVKKYCNNGMGFFSFCKSQPSLPRKLKNYGYRSEFITTGDLRFNNKGQWLKSLGFNYIEGSTHPYYENWERFHFNAAPDEALYERLKQRIKDLGSEKPYFLFAETVSTHHPFLDPIKKSRKEQDVFRYADKQLGDFYDYLKTTSFFDNSLLIIVSDHRSMTPVRSQEVKKYKDRIFARIPLIVVDGKSHPKIITEAFQQTDLYHSIIGLVSGEITLSLFTGMLLTDNLIPPKYILYPRGDQRDVITVYNKNKSGNVKLAGDNTAFINGKVDNSSLVINKINFERLKKQCICPPATQ